MKKLFSLLIFLIAGLTLTAQDIPQGFNYQAVLRDATGNIISNGEVTVELSVENDLGNVQWVESHSATTNQFGLISLIMGDGMRLGGTATGFAQIDWNTEQLYIGTVVVYNDNRIDMGTSEIMSVPYSLVSETAVGISGELNNLDIVESADATEGEPLFEVKNNGGQTVFAVYNEGVEIYIDDSEEKGIKGSFAVKGFGGLKGDETNYMIVNGDSARIYIDNGSDQLKGIKGGFAVQGFKDITKGDTEDYLRITRDSSRIYINDNTGDKGIKGSFAVQGFKNTGKGDNSNYFDINMDETSSVIDPGENRILWYPQRNAFLAGRVFIKEVGDVGINSFAVGYESRAKGDYSQAMGYKAYADGINSTSIGRNSIASGLNSYAFGQKAKALATESYAVGMGAYAGESGLYGYAIGREAHTSDTSGYAIGTNALSVSNNAVAFGTSAEAKNNNSYAFGQGAISAGIEGYALGKEARVDSAASYGYAIGKEASVTSPSGYAIGHGAIATNNSSYAIGMGAIASGLRSFAFGSSGLDSLDNATNVVEAGGDYSIAIGLGAYTSGNGSIAIGIDNTASGRFSTALGYQTLSSGHASLATGSKTIASGSYATAMGYNSNSGEFASTAMGMRSNAAGFSSFAAGYNNNAQNFGSAALGSYSVASGHSSIAIGNHVTAPSYMEIAMGFYNTSYTPVAVSYPASPRDRLFVIGNGTKTEPSDAFVVLKDGSVGIGTSDPSEDYKLSIETTEYGLNVKSTSSTVNSLAINSFSSGGIESYAYYGRAEGATRNYGMRLISSGSGVSNQNYGVHAYAYGDNLNYGIYAKATGGTVNYAGFFEGTVHVIGDIHYTGEIDQVSDIRYKTDIENIEDPMSKLMVLNGVSYNWRTGEFPDMGFDGERHMGVIAQEVEQVLPELVETDKNGYKSVAYSKLTPLLIEAVKEQQNEIDTIKEQQTEIEDLKRENEELKARINAIEEILKL